MHNDSSIKGRVLIADDDNDNRTLLAFILEAEGWKITEARDGKEALEKAIQEQPDLVILDNRMPELTGLRVYEQLRQRGISIPVVFISAYSELRDLASTYGIRYFLIKPIEVPELITTIESACREK